MEVGIELRDKKIADKFGALNKIPESCYVYGKRAAILTTKMHYTLGERLLRNRIYLPLAKYNIVLMWASSIIPANVTNPCQFLTTLNGTTQSFYAEYLSGELIS